MAKQREAVFHSHFIEEWRYWVQTDRKLALRARALVEEILCDSENYCTNTATGTGRSSAITCRCNLIRSISRSVSAVK